MILALFMILYRTLLFPTIMIVGFPLLYVMNKKFREGLALRRRPVEWPRFQEKPFWIHAASGEFEYAKPLVRELKRRHPSIPIVVTHFSPSFASAIANTPGVDFVMPLPLDLPGPVTTFFRRLQPRVLLISRTDLWPEVLYQARERKVPAVLFSARQTPGNFLKNLWSRFLFSLLTEIYCVSPEDKEALERLGTQTPVHVAGDTRYDQVRFRLQNPKSLRTDLKPSRTTLVAGSTWPEDERVLIQATRSLLSSKEIQLILVPHEPTPSHLKSLEEQIRQSGLSSQRYSEPRAWTEPILLIDQIGILAELYTWGQIAFVGGSFKKSVHSVMEPLAAGLPTLVGPFHKGNREALEFQKLKFEGLSLVSAVYSASDLEAQLLKIMEAQAQGPALRTHILKEVDARTGGTARISESIPSLQSSSAL